MAKYYGLQKNTPDYKFSQQQYSLRTKLNFIKQNITNPYAIDLFSFFVIGPKSNFDYDEIYQFYTNNLKGNIKSIKIKLSIENKIEQLKQPLDEGNKAPFYSVRSIENQLINRDTLLGKNVLLTFWATWCGPCVKELPYLKEIHEKYNTDNLVIIAISLDKDSIKMANTINEKKLNWVHVFNSRSMLEAFRINPIPAIFLIDERGIIRYNSANRENETSELKILKSVLAQKFRH